MKAHFRVHTINLLKEIVDGAMPRTMGVLFVPINTFKALLGKVAERAIELNDPIMNMLMYDLTLYSIADPESPDYDEKAMQEIYDLAYKQKIKEKKLSHPCSTLE